MSVIRGGHKMNEEQARVYDAWIAEREAALPEPPNILDRLRSGAWLDAQTFAPICWAVPGLIPEGFILFTGPPKAGKSWAILDVCLAVASGGRAFGRIGVGAARPVLLLALEDGDRRMQGRYRSLLQDQPIPSLLEYVTEATPREALEIIKAWLAVNGHRNPLVVLDTLGKVMPPSLPGEGAYQRDYRIGGGLKGLVSAYPGATLVAVHHVRKAAIGEGADWMDSTSGTNGLNGAADATVNLVRPRNETAGLVRVAGRDVPEGEYAITCERGQWTLDGLTLADAARTAEQSRATASLGDRSVEVLAYVAGQSESVTPKQVEKALELPEARRYLARLATSGRLAKHARGLYSAVPTVPMSQLDGAPESLPMSQVGGGSDGWDSGTVGTGPQQACTTCGEPLASYLADAGETTHPTCELAS